MPIREVRAERQELRVPVSFWAFGQDSVPHTGYTTDVSATGVFIATNSPLAPETVILIRIEDHERQLVVSGVIARVVKALAALQSGRHSGMGIHFQDREHAAVRRLSQMAQ
jgi:Tfp pilus assembly protein PilZ